MKRYIRAAEVSIAAPLQAHLFGAVLPGSRPVHLAATAKIFATLINGHNVTLEHYAPLLARGFPGLLSSHTIDATTDVVAVTFTANAAVTLAPR